MSSVTSQGLGVLVSWAPNAASDAVTGYAVSVSVASGAQTPAQGCSGPFTSTVDGSQSAALVGGLCAGVAYQATVAATNAGGTSAASSPFGPVAALPAQAPPAPLLLGTYARESSLLVAWAPPATTGGSAITGYTLTATPASGSAVTVQASGSATSGTLPGLNDGTAYAVTLTATNAIGTSPAATGSGTPAAVHPATAPVGVSAAPDGSGDVTVSWTAPVDNGGSTITGYTVSWQQVTQKKAGGAYKAAKKAVKHTATVAASTTTYTVPTSGFTPATALYAFTVTATNTAGPSLAGAPTSPVSPVTTLTGNATVLAASTMSDLVSDVPTATGRTLVWAAPVPTQISGLQTGAVLVASPGGAAAQGLIDTVTALSTGSDGSVTATTTTAALTDVFSTLALSNSADPAASSGTAQAAFRPAMPGIRALAPATGQGQIDVANPQASVTVSLDKRLGVDYAPPDSDGAFVSGEVDVNPQLSMTINLDHGLVDIPDGGNLTASAVVKASATLKIGFKTPKNWTATLGEIDGEPEDIQVGPVPVVVVPKTVVQVNVSGQIADVLTETMTVGASLAWNSHQPTNLTAKNLSTLNAGGGWLPQLAATGTGTAKLIFQPQLDFYDAAGPNVQSDAGATVTANLAPKPGKPYLTVAPFVSTDVGLDIDLFGQHQKLEVTLDTIDFKTYTLVHGPAGQLTVSPAQISVAPGANATFTASGGSSALTWALANGAGDTISTAGVFTAAAPGGRSVTVDVRDAAGDVGQAVVNVGAAFDPVQDLTATLSGDQTSATVNWQAPAATGGSAVAHYTVTTSAGRPTQTVTGTTATISGLQPGGSYLISVYPINHDGQTGPPSSTAPAVSPSSLTATSLSGLYGGNYCALLSGGTVDCWGYNTYGDLGNGTTTDSDVPVEVSNLTAATSLVTDDEGFCALMPAGTADCWGYNGYGDLGNGTTTNSDVPVKVNGLTGATALVSGQDGYCALLSGGTADCWGYNAYGELGNGTTTNSAIPVKVNGLSGATALASDDSGYCALLAGGTADCWGINAHGELGNGTTTNSAIPVEVSNLTGATSLVSGYQGYCALLSGGTVDCWGVNDGNSANNTDSDVPVKVNGLTGATALVSGQDGYCALLSGGTADCWGYNAYGELGNGTTTNSAIPVKVNGLSGATALASDDSGYCALLAGGTADCWGINAYGELGNGTTTNSDVPVKVNGLSGATALDGGYCALLSGGTVDCWGYNGHGALGNGSTTDSDVPVPVSPFS